MTDLPPPQNPPPHEPQKLHHAPEVKQSRIHHILLGLLAVFALIAVAGIVARVAEAHKLRKTTDANAIQTVAVITARAGAEDEEIALPGTVQAWHEAVIYARTSGYLKSWNVDIGAHVKEGDVLAEIDAPDLDAQYHQAQADLQAAIANNKIAQITAKRNLELRKTDSISQQQADQAVAAAEADAAAVASQKANLDHLQQQEDFKKVVAPFDGTVTARNIDVGALVVGDASGNNGQDLFHIAQTDKLRVYVQVPELDAPAVTPDLVAELHFPQYPQKIFTAKLSRTADALDPTTRTLLAQLEVDNADGALMPGGFTDAHLKVPQSGQAIILPVNTLLFRDIERVGIVKDGKVTLQPIKIGRDFGKSVEVISGVSAGDQVVINPPDSLQDGQQVHTKEQDKDKKQDEPKPAEQKQPDAAPQNDQQNKVDEKTTLDQSQTNNGANVVAPVDSNGQPQNDPLHTGQGNQMEKEQTPDPEAQKRQ